MLTPYCMKLLGNEYKGKYMINKSSMYPFDSTQLDSIHCDEVKNRVQNTSTDVWSPKIESNRQMYVAQKGQYARQQDTHTLATNKSYLACQFYS